MNELRTSLVIDLAGNLKGKSREFSRSLDRFSRDGSKSISTLNRAMSHLGRGLDRLGNRYTALLTGAAGVGSVKYVAELQERLKQLQVDSGASAEKIDELKTSIFALARDPNIRLAPESLIGGVEEIVTKTGDLDFAIQNLKNMGLAIRAAKAEGKDVGAVMTNLYKGGVRDPKEILSTIDALIKQAKTGSVAFRDIANVGNGLFAPYVAAGRKGMQSFKDMGAVSQVTIDAVKSVDEAVTATSALISQLEDPKVQKVLSGAGIKVFDGKEMRSLPKLIREIIKAAGGDITKIGTVITDRSALKVFQGAMMEGGLDRMDSLAKMAADGSGVLKDAATNAETLSAALTSINSALKNLAENKLLKPVGWLADGLNKVDAQTQDLLLELGLGGFGALGAGILGRKGYKGIRWARGLFRKTGAGNGSGGLGVPGGGFGGAIPVYVVNGPSSIWPGSEPGPGSDVKKVAKLSPLAATSAALVPAAGAAIVGAVGMEAVKKLDEYQVKHYSTSRLKELITQQMVLGGGPDTFQAKLMKAELDRRFMQGVDVGGTVEIRINTEGKPTVTTLKTKDKRIDFDVDQGQMMASH